jgi:serine protease AprX
MNSRLIAVAVLFAAFASAKHRKVDPELDDITPIREVPVIVRFKASPDDRQHRKVTQRGGRHGGNLNLIRSGKYALPAGKLEELADDPDVEFIAPDRPVHAALDLTAAAINAAPAWNAGYEGQGIGVAVIDSGVYKHDTYLRVGSTSGARRVVYSQDFTGSGTTDDQFGHGSHVAGIIANCRYHTAPNDYSRKIVGIAPNAKLINLKVLDRNGVGSDSNVIAAIEKAIELKAIHNIAVINLSLGRPVTTSYLNDPLCQAVERAWKAGIVVVVAAGNHGRTSFAGNQGYGTITSPGNDPYVITVGAMKAHGTPNRGDDTIASYSSKGPTLIDNIVKPDILAPGNQVVSLYPIRGTPTIPANYPGTLIKASYYHSSLTTYTSDSYYKLNGTSMAAPAVAAAAALMIQKDPSLTPDQVKARLMKTAYKAFPTQSTAYDPDTGASYTAQYDLFTVGAGYLDIGAAMANFEKSTGPALSPKAIRTADGKIAVQFAAGSAIGGSNIIWGTNNIWGTNVIWGTNIVWGTNIIWGTSGTQGYNIIWGTGGSGTSNSNVIWGTNALRIVESMAVLTRGE